MPQFKTRSFSPGKVQWTKNTPTPPHSPTLCKEEGEVTNHGPILMRGSNLWSDIYKTRENGFRSSPEEMRARKVSEQRMRTQDWT